MHEDFKYVKSLEKEIDELESEKADFSNMYDLLLEECVSKDVICSYLHSLSELNAHTELQCMYLHKVKECECGKCVCCNSNLTACVSRYLKDLNAVVENYASLGTVRFGNDKFALILGYGDLNQGNVTIKWVYYVEGLNHNLFSIGQFCDADLEETTSSTPICFIGLASPHSSYGYGIGRISLLNFESSTLLSKKDIVTGLPKLTYVKDQLCSSCEMSKAKRSSFKSKVVPSSKGRLNLASKDLLWSKCGLQHNWKKYILVIVMTIQETWTLFLRSKDETPEVLKDFLTMIQRNLQAQVISVRTDRGTEFLNKTLHAYFKEEGIETSILPSSNA
ncbi:retrovirus-related pol polyprotein from transposon TNT 1-94 [Tanacetum coccineum]